MVPAPTCPPPPNTHRRYLRGLVVGTKQKLCGTILFAFGLLFEYISVYRRALGQGNCILQLRLVVCLVHRLLGVGQRGLLFGSVLLLSCVAWLPTKVVELFLFRDGDAPAIRPIAGLIWSTVGTRLFV